MQTGDLARRKNPNRKFRRQNTKAGFPKTRKKALKGKTGNGSMKIIPTSHKCLPRALKVRIGNGSMRKAPPMTVKAKTGSGLMRKFPIRKLQPGSPLLRQKTKAGNGYMKKITPPLQSTVRKLTFLFRYSLMPICSLRTARATAAGTTKSACA